MKSTKARTATHAEINGHDTKGKSCKNCTNSRCAEFRAKHGKGYYKAYEYQDFEGYYHLCAYYCS